MNDKIVRAEAWLNLCDDMGGEQYVGELGHRELFDAGWDAALEGDPHALVVEAIERLNAASVPLGMTEQQFNAATILDVKRILTRPLSDDAAPGGVE